MRSDRPADWVATCEYCGKQFNNTVALDNHVRVHTGEKPFACKDCAQRFATEAALSKYWSYHQNCRRLSRCQQFTSGTTLEKSLWYVPFVGTLRRM